MNTKRNNNADAYWNKEQEVLKQGARATGAQSGLYVTRSYVILVQIVAYIILVRECIDY